MSTGPGDHCKPHGNYLPCEECREASERAYNAERDALFEERSRESLNIEFAQADKRQREATAATVLAALIQLGRGTTAHYRPETIAEAVTWADALRAELERKP